MRQTFIKGICFVALLAFTLWLSNGIYTRFFYKQDVVEADAQLLFDLDSLQHLNDVLYFAESSNTTTSPNDTCQAFISRLAPEVKIAEIQHGAYHGKLYLDLIKNIEKGSRVKTIIVTMNLRSFGALWINSALETAIMKADVMYRQLPPIFKRSMLAFGQFDNKTWEERVPVIRRHWKEEKINVPADFKYQNTLDWDLGMGMSGIYLLPDSTWDFKKVEFACNFIKILGFSIDTLTNPRIKDFDEIVEVAKEKNLNLVFNLLPENVQFADSLAGKELVSLIRQNRDLLVKRYNKNGVIVVDNLELVDGKNFIEQDQVTEHYTQTGRKVVAANVAKIAGKYLRH